MQFLVKHLHGPLVGNDVVDGQEKEVFLAVQMYESPAKQRRFGEVEGRAALLARNTEPFALLFPLVDGTQVEYRQHHVD